jgi:hypothetical protein
VGWTVRKCGSGRFNVKNFCWYALARSGTLTSTTTRERRKETRKKKIIDQKNRENISIAGARPARRELN